MVIVYFRQLVSPRVCFDCMLNLFDILSLDNAMQMRIAIMKNSNKKRKKNVVLIKTILTKLIGCDNVQEAARGPILLWFYSPKPAETDLLPHPEKVMKFIKASNLYRESLAALIKDIHQAEIETKLVDSLTGLEINPMDSLRDHIDSQKKCSRRCTTCGVMGETKLLKCSICKSVHYCSIECQMIDRVDHKTHCKAIADGLP